MKVLICGFEPFGEEPVNPAQQVVRALPSRLGAAAIERAELPVSFGRDVRALRAAIERHDPDVVLCLGQAGGRAEVTPEFVGINYIRARIPDNDGARPCGRPVVEGGPDAHFATVPVHGIAECLQEAGIPSRVSYTAGTFCCNEVLYAALHMAATERPRMRAGFIHLPYLPEQASRKEPGTPSMPLGTMVRAVELAIGAC